jgi:Na+-driven multidrug efflux pump
MALVVFLLNIFFPGTGTIVAGILSGGDKVKNNVIVGILQWLLCFILIGWIWSIVTGYQIYKIAKAIPG